MARKPFQETFIAKAIGGIALSVIASFIVIYIQKSNEPVVTPQAPLAPTGVTGTTTPPPPPPLPPTGPQSVGGSGSEGYTGVASAPPPTPQPTYVAQDSRPTDPAVLSSCNGLSPLQLNRIQVSSLNNGYRVVMQVSNPTSWAIALTVEPGFTSSDDIGHSSTNAGNSNPRPLSLEAAYIHLAENDSSTLHVMQALFDMGEDIEPGQSGSISFDFAEQTNGGPGNYLTFNAGLGEVFRDANGQYQRRTRQISCTNIPVMSRS